MTQRKFAVTAVLGAIGLVAFAGQPNAQSAPAAPDSATIGFMHAIHATNAAQRTLDFYTRVFGLTGEVRPFANAGVPLLTNSPGVTLQVAMVRFPGHGFNFELTQFSNVERHAAQPGIADPGAPRMIVLVRDLEPVVAAVRSLGAPVLTHGGEPIRVRTAHGEVESIVFRDPDGYIVEAARGTPRPDSPDGNVLGSIMGLTVEDLDESLEFWRDRLGFETAGNVWHSEDSASLDLYGLASGSALRTVAATVPGSDARIEFMQVEGAQGPHFDLRVPDPGAAGMAIRVAAIGDLLASLKSAGVRVLSKDERLVEWSPTVRNVFVKDPNGLNIELVGTVDP